MKYTLEQRKNLCLKYLEGLRNGLTRTKACRQAGCSYYTISAWTSKSKKFQQLIDDALHSRIRMVEDRLFQLALDGNLGACIFWLKNRVPESWRDAPQINIDNRSVHTHLTIERSKDADQSRVLQFKDQFPQTAKDNRLEQKNTL